jgi:hypothetical protein
MALDEVLEVEGAGQADAGGEAVRSDDLEEREREAWLGLFLCYGSLGWDWVSSGSGEDVSFSTRRTLFVLAGV